MFAFFYNVITMLAAAADTGSSGGFSEFYNKYLNYPGFEAWKFLNLAIFVSIFVYIAKKPLSEAFKAKRESIRAELIKAEEEKQSALKLLTSAEAKLAAVENEKGSILTKAREEAEAEKRRLAEQAESDLIKLKEQSGGEIERLQKQTLAQLRRFSAEESVRLAEEKLIAQIDDEKDRLLVRGSIESIGGLSHK